MDQASVPQAYFKPDAQPHFTYKSLPTTGKVIRILTLHGGEGNEPLCASVSVQDLDSKPEFEALSYVWGSPEPKKVLRIDGKDFFLRPNISSFLLRLRYPSRSRKLWLDSVCIDQNNISERGSQISHMRDIYRSCRQCIVWLGEATSRGDEVLEVFRDNPVDERGMTDLNNLVRLLYQRNLTDSFRILLNNPYWTRVWMIQETTLPETVVVQCGQSSCMLDQIPTQVREIMFEVFQQHRVQYQQWIQIFKNFELRCTTLSLPPTNAEAPDKKEHMFPLVAGHFDLTSRDTTFFLGFRKVQGKHRWVPVVVELEDGTNSRSARVHSVISLSTVSALSFACDGFDATKAFHAIESVFWCVSKTDSEQLLDERRRHSTANNRQFATVDFRNYLETIDRWYCTDIRDRVFGALGVFEIWPQAQPYRADYHLTPAEMLISVVDYCRPTDPFKLAIKLLSALAVDSSCIEQPTNLTSVTIMSRISWTMSVFLADPVTIEGNDKVVATRLQELDAPTPAQTFLYLTPHGDSPKPSDAIVSIGDASMVLGVRESRTKASWACVGIGFDAKPGMHLNQAKAEVLAILEGIDIRNEEGMSDLPVNVKQPRTQPLEQGVVQELLIDLTSIHIQKAVAEDEGIDGTPVLWWTTLLTTLFWYCCRREKQKRVAPDDVYAECDDGHDILSNAQIASSQDWSRSSQRSC